MRAPSRAPRRLLTPTEKDSIRREIADYEQQLRAPDIVGAGPRGVIYAPNPQFSSAHSATALRRVSILKRRLEQGSTEDLSRKATQKRDARIKALEALISGRMVPRKFYKGKRDDVNDYHRTVKHLANVEMGPENQRDVAELKNLYRARSESESRTAGARENPTSGSIEHLRQQ